MFGSQTLFSAAAVGLVLEGCYAVRLRLALHGFDKEEAFN